MFFKLSCESEAVASNSIIPVTRKKIGEMLKHSLQNFEKS